MLKYIAMFLDALVIFAIGFTVFHSPINTEIIRGLSVETTALASGLNRNGRHFANDPRSLDSIAGHRHQSDFFRSSYHRVCEVAAARCSAGILSSSSGVEIYSSNAAKQNLIVFLYIKVLSARFVNSILLDLSLEF